MSTYYLILTLHLLPPGKQRKETQQCITQFGRSVTEDVPVFSHLLKNREASESISVKCFLFSPLKHRLGFLQLSFPQCVSKHVMQLLLSLILISLDKQKPRLSI